MCGGEYDSVCTNPNDGAQKGASIVPYSEDSSTRDACRGAPANAGGGGNSHNAPGGGGANVCGNIISNPWNGKGVSRDGGRRGGREKLKSEE